MDNMTPRDFNVHVYPTFRLDEDADLRVGGLAEAANEAAGALKKALKKGTKMDGSAAGAVEEALFADTEAAFVAAIESIVAGDGQDVEESWLARLRKAVLRLFDQHAVPALANRNLSHIEDVVAARRNLLIAFSKQKGIRDKLGLSARDKETVA